MFFPKTIFLSSGGLYAFSPSSSTCWLNFFHCFGNLFCLYFFILSQYLFTLPSFATTFWFLSSISLSVLFIFFLYFVPTCSSVIPLSHHFCLLSLISYQPFQSNLPNRFWVSVNFFRGVHRFFHGLIFLLRRLVRFILWFCLLRYVLTVRLFFQFLSCLFSSVRFLVMVI